MKKISTLYHQHKRLILYIFFGGVTTLVNIIVYNLMYYLMDYSNVLSTGVAWLAAVITAFLTNKEMVFESKSWKWDVLWKEGLRFVECRIGTGLLEVVFMYVTVDCFSWNGFIMKLVTNVIVILLNYVASKKVIFVKK